MKQWEITQGDAPILVLVPHEDDEVILFGGLIARCMSLGVSVTVALATNGDYGDTDGRIGRARLQESLLGLGDLGLPEENVIFLGYADTGMPQSESFLAGLYAERSGNKLHPSHVGTKTYGLPSHPDYRMQTTGRAADYTKNAFTRDLGALLAAVRPKTVFTTHPLDAHGDHAVLYQFLRELAPVVRTYSGFAHSAGGDAAWPLSGEQFTCPPECEAQCEEAVRLLLTDTERAQKRRALLRHKTARKPDAVAYLDSFIKADEIYFPMEAAR